MAIGVVHVAVLGDLYIFCIILFISILYVGTGASVYSSSSLLLFWAALIMSSLSLLLAVHWLPGCFVLCLPAGIFRTRERTS